MSRRVSHPEVAAGRAPARLLIAEEAEQYQGYLSPRRRRDWLLGRWTAKRLIQMHIAANDGYTPPLDSFHIAYEPTGAPYVASPQPALCSGYDPGRVPLALAISHSHGYALCALAANTSGKVRVGADIELVESRPATLVEEFFTTAEQAHLRDAPAEMRDLLITATWSAKEAVLKATQLGIRTDPRGVECLLPPMRPRHWAPLHVRVEPAIQAQSQGVGPLALWWRVVENRLRPGTLFTLTIASYGTTI